jgi:flagellar hook-length control protein FliK
MTVVLTPETLGPVEVRVTLAQGSVELSMRGSTEAARAALLDSLPDLRRDLESAGLSCSRASVDRDTGGAWSSSQQQAPGERAGTRDDDRPRGWLRADDRAPTPAPHSSSTSTGVDVLA